MKELEKTKRISIAAVLFILAVIIALLAYERPKHLYSVNTQDTLDMLLNKDYFIGLEEINNPDYILIDIRNNVDFEKGHLENAINIHTPDLLNETNTKIFKELKETNKVAILYGNNPTEANSSFMILYQLGYTSKILLIENTYLQTKLITKNSEIGKSVADVNAFIAASQKNANVKPKPVKKTPKKIVTVKKKKKMPVEGGC
ncbi:MAG: rhodanese-like domain-containing protein [Bacteroidetes bacterium]|nr:rhodanese-like domain-containing protein [Bacteroidota bacterium]